MIEIKSPMSIVYRSYKQNDTPFWGQWEILISIWKHLARTDSRRPYTGLFLTSGTPHPGQTRVQVDFQLMMQNVEILSFSTSFRSKALETKRISHARDIFHHVEIQFTQDYRWSMITSCLVLQIWREVLQGVRPYFYETEFSTRTKSFLWFYSNHWKLINKWENFVWTENSAKWKSPHRKSPNKFPLNLSGRLKPWA